VTRYILRRLFFSAIVLFAVITVTFFMLYLTGDPIAAILRQAGSDPVEIAKIRHHYGFDQPLLVQYVHFLGRLAHGDLGLSITSAQPALDLVRDRLPYTLALTAAALVLSLLVAIPLGLYSALHQGGLSDRLVGLSVAGFQSVPSLVVGPFLILGFAVSLQIFPVSGASGFTAVILPAITLALFPIAVISRVLRASVLDVLPLDFVTIARAKGLRERAVLYRHVLRSALLPVLTVSGLVVAELLGGAVIVENIFAWPGLGQLSVQALINSDFALMRCIIIVVATGVVIVTLVTDIVYGFIDPRVRDA
jgi:peptide/nickel transport system permease protein